MGRCRAWPSVIGRLPCRLARPHAVCLFVVRSSNSFLHTQTDWHAVRCVCTPSALLVRTGLLSPLASQPFDTIKTKMQAEARYAKEGPVSVGRAILRTEGLAGMYRGMMPILLSTGVQKSALFAGYAGAKRWCDQSKIALLAAPLPGLNGMNLSVVVGSVTASTARTLVETPFELAKVRKQTGGTFRSAAGVFSLKQISELYTGAFATWGRATMMLTTFFVLCDQAQRTAPELMSRPILGGFIKGGACATIAWGVAWPVEVVKSKVQGVEAARYQGQSTVSILQQIARTEGLKGLYRGFLPGAIRSCLANGVGMAVYQLTQSWRSD